MAFEFPDLPYDFSALEPHVDAQTMEIHYDRHHRAYFTNFTGAIDGSPLADQSLEQVMAGIDASTTITLCTGTPCAMAVVHLAARYPQLLTVRSVQWTSSKKS